jgi:hypothetical protein
LISALATYYTDNPTISAITLKINGTSYTYCVAVEVNDSAEFNAALTDSSIPAIALVGGTYELSSSNSSSKRIVVLSGESVTLDLGGKTLTGSVELHEGKLTIQNGTLKNSSRLLMFIHLQQM